MTIRLTWEGREDTLTEHPCGEPLVTTTVLGGGGGTPGARLIEGDNLEALRALDEEGVKAALIYLDPPFATGQSFEASLSVGSSQVKVPAFEDTYPTMQSYLEMMEPRLRRSYDLLAEDGSLYVHVDPGTSHYLKVLLDEIFGEGCFQREIIWRIGWVSGYKSAARNWIRNHDTILYYVKDPARFTFHKTYLPYPEGYVRRDGKPPKGKGIPIDDVWNAGPGDLGLSGSESLDSIQIKSFSREKTGWATQKNESLLRRIIAASSNPGDLVLDPFCGSGSTLAAALSLGREGVGCDASPLALQMARRRLRGDGHPVTLQHVPSEGSTRGDPDASVEIDVPMWRKGLEVRLVDYVHGYPETEVAAILPHVQHWSDWIASWTVAPSGAIHRPVVERYRRDPMLSLTTDPDEVMIDREFMVEITDILGHTMRLHVEP